MALRKHISLTANTAASVTLTAKPDIERETPNYKGGDEHVINRRVMSVLLINKSEDDSVYYRFDGINPSASGADDDWILPPRSSYQHTNMSHESITIVLISTGTPAVSVLANS